jgi:hypothetical protein
LGAAVEGTTIFVGDGMEDEENRVGEVTSMNGLDVGVDESESGVDGGESGVGVGILVELVLTTVGPGPGAEFIPSKNDIEIPEFIHVEHGFGIRCQDPGGRYIIDGSVLSTVTFAASTLWCACSQQSRRTIKRRTVVHILVDDVLFIGNSETLSWIS